MLRSGLLAALMICGAPALAAPRVLVSLDDRVDMVRPMNIARDPLLVPPPPGFPVTWDSLLDPVRDAPVQDVCDAIGAGKIPEGGRHPVDPAQILSKLVDLGYCGDETG